MSNNVINYCVPLVQALDYTLEDCKDRVELVEGVFNKDNTNTVDGLGGLDNFWIDIFEQTSKDGIDTSYTRACLNQNDMLYTDTYIAKMLEVIGTYLIMSPDIREQEKSNQDKIRIYHSRELFKRALKERDKINKMAELSDNTLDVFVKEKNYRKATDIKIPSKAIKENDCLREYNDFLELLQEKNRKLSSGASLSKEDLKNRSIIRKQIASVKQDMIEVYKSIYRPIKFKQPLMGHSSPDWNALDMTQDDVVTELLKINKSDDITDDLNDILIDLDILIDKIEFTDKQQEILNMYRSGTGISEIAEILNITKQCVHRMIKGIVKKIVDTYIESYSDWYYLNVSKGEYKTCKCCGATKLVANFYKRENWYALTCKSCMKNDRKSLKTE